MHSRTRHRGPDDEGFYESDGISLAHNRLSIIDLSPAGHQPMTTPDGRWTIVFNGEIYNYRELKSELERLGESFRSSSDTEVLLRAFARWGEAVLPRLNGIFAFAIWDRDERTLTLARDHVGVKPLYYHRDGDRLVFSSEIKAILEAGMKREIDLDALNTYLRLLYVPTPKTMFAGIKKLPPGHVAMFKGGKLELRRYWRLKEGEAIPSYQEAVEGVRARTLEAVRRQLVSDRPLGVFLSGGIDSTSVLAAMRAAQPGGEIETFTIGYEKTDEAEKYNADARLARETSNYFGTTHHEFVLAADDVLANFEKIIWHMDEPIANHVQPSTYVIARESKPEITVALGGDGGDELFCGYPRYWYAAFLERLRMFRFIAEATRGRGAWVRPAPSRASGGQGFLDKLTAKPGLERQLAFVAQKEASISPLLAGGVNRPMAAQEAIAPAFDRPWRDETNRLAAADLETWIPDESLMRTDKLTMAHGLEERVPLLDLDLIEYAFRIPSKWKIGHRANQGKRVFIDAMRPLLPPHVLSEEKRAWMSPASKWLRGPLGPFAHEVLSASYCSATRDLFDFDAITRMFDRHVSKEEYNLSLIWALMTFQVWAKGI
jgi:asparagine synthase (glutamine-hydrolysing)